MTNSGINVTFDITWENSWNLGAGYTVGDGVWVVVKQAPNGGPSWIHANVVSATVGANYETIISDDNVGFFIKHTNSFNGTSSTSVTATYSFGGTYRDIKVMAVEVVRIPTGAFDVGDGWSDRAYHRGDDPTASYEMLHEGQITEGNTSTDMGGLHTGAVVPADYPKGFSQFYCMKYQITMEQYVDFLNCQPRAWQDTLTNTSLIGTTISDYYVMSESSTLTADNVIRCDATIGTGNVTFYCDRDNDGIPDEESDGQHRAINRLTIGQFLAYLDWIGLAPMTTFEYEKACRGPLPAVPGEFAWGSTLYNAAGSRINTGEPDEKYSNSGTTGGIVLSGTSEFRSVRVGCNAPATAGTRELSNGSYYGVIGLSFFSNSVIGTSSTLLTYDGAHGDGNLTNGYQDDFGIIDRLQSKTNPSSIMSSTNDKNRVSSRNGDTVGIKTIGVSGRGVRRF